MSSLTNTNTINGTVQVYIVSWGRYNFGRGSAPPHTSTKKGRLSRHLVDEAQPKLSQLHEVIIIFNAHTQELANYPFQLSVEKHVCSTTLSRLASLVGVNAYPNRLVNLVQAFAKLLQPTKASSRSPP